MDYRSIGSLRSAKGPISIRVGARVVILRLVGPGDRYFGVGLLPSTTAGKALKAGFLEQNQLQTLRSRFQFCAQSELRLLGGLD